MAMMIKRKPLVSTALASAVLSLCLMGKLAAQPQIDHDLDGVLDGAEQVAPGNPAIAAAARLREAVGRIDPNAEFGPSGASFNVQDMALTLVYDTNANRMRILLPIAQVETVDEAGLMRLMQANFDSALDARYAVANGVIWSTFLHPLTSLTNEDFASGIGQTVNIALTYGSSFSSGAIVFGGGDSNEEHRKLIEELTEKSKEI